MSDEYLRLATHHLQKGNLDFKTIAIDSNSGSVLLHLCFYSSNRIARRHDKKNISVGDLAAVFAYRYCGVVLLDAA